MSKVIQFLESMGRAPVSAADYAASIAAIGVNEGQKQALLNRDHAALNDLMGGPKKMFFGVFPAYE